MYAKEKKREKDSQEGYEGKDQGCHSRLRSGIQKKKKHQPDPAGAALAAIMLFEDRGEPVATSTLPGHLSTFLWWPKKSTKRKADLNTGLWLPSHEYPTAAGSKTRSDKLELRQFEPFIRSMDTQSRLC
jgi:hypothetical protein